MKTYKTKEFQRCTHPKQDCTACADGICIALHDTDFGKKDCPFYMDRKTSREVKKQCKERLERIRRR